MNDKGNKLHDDSFLQDFVFLNNSLGGCIYQRTDSLSLGSKSLEASEATNKPLISCRCMGHQV